MLSNRGVGIAKKLWVGTDPNVAGTSTTGTIVPSATQTYNLGTAENRCIQALIPVEFRGNLIGNVTGTVQVVLQTLIN